MAQQKGTELFASMTSEPQVIKPPDDLFLPDTGAKPIEPPPDLFLSDTSQPSTQQAASAKPAPSQQQLPAASPSFVQSAWNAATEPLLNRVNVNGTQIYDPKAAANFYDPQNQDPTKQAQIPDWVPYVGGGTYRSLLAGGLEGAGNVVGGLSSPLNLATMGSFKGAGTLAKAAPTVARGLRYAGGALSAPVLGHGAYTTATAPTLGGKAQGLAEMAGGTLGIMGLPGMERYGNMPIRKPGIGNIKPTPSSGAASVAQDALLARQRADQIVKAGAEPLLKPEEIPAAKARYQQLRDKVTNRQPITPAELQEGQMLDKKLREVNFGETGLPGSQEAKQQQQQQQPPAQQQPQQPGITPNEGVQPPPPAINPEEQAVRDQTAQQPPIEQPTIEQPTAPAPKQKPAMKGGIRQPAKEYPGYKGEVSDESVANDDAEVEAGFKAGEFKGGTPPTGRKIKPSKLTDTKEVAAAGQPPKEPPEEPPVPPDEGGGGEGEGPETPESLKSKIKFTPESPVLNRLANFSGKATRMVLGFHIPGTAYSFHGMNVAVRNTIFGPDFSPVGAAKRFANTAEYLARPNRANDYLTVNAADLAKAVEDGGLKATTDIGYSSMFKGGNVVTKGINYLTDPTPLFGKVVPALKLRSYQGLLKQYTDSGMPYEQAAKLAGYTTNNIFGGLNLKALKVTPTGAKIARVAFLAPDWLGTNLLIGKEMVSALKNPSSIQGRAYQVGMANFMGSYVALNVLNALNNNGKFMFQNEPGHELDVASGKDAKGRIRYFSPYGTAMDMVRIPVAIAHSAVKGDIGESFRMVRARTSELGQIIFDLASNTDYKGSPLYGKEKFGKPIPVTKQFGNVTGDIASHLIPIGAEASLDFYNKKISTEQFISQVLQLPMKYRFPDQKKLR